MEDSLDTDLSILLGLTNKTHTSLFQKLELHRFERVFSVDFIFKNALFTRGEGTIGTYHKMAQRTSVQVQALETCLLGLEKTTTALEGLLQELSAVHKEREQRFTRLQGAVEFADSSFEAFSQHIIDVCKTVHAHKELKWQF